MTLKAYSVQPGGGVKSIPLNALPAEAWRSITGGQGDGGDLIARYEDVPWLYRSVNLIADALANMPWEFHAPNGDVVDDPKLPFDFDVYDVMNSAAGDFVLYGACYWHKGTNVVGKPTLLKRLHPRTMKPVYDDMEGLKGFERQLGSRMIPLAPEDVAYVWHTNRKAELGPGAPPAHAALKAAGLLHFTDAYSTAYFANGAVEPTVMFVEGNPSDADLDAVESRLRRMATGIAKAFKLVALRFKPEIVKLGTTPDKLALPELTTGKREDIATAMGIPQSMLFSNAANYATARQDKINLYDETVIPLALRIAKTLTDDVFSAFGLELKPHPERLEVFQAMEAEKSEALSMMIDRRVITGNEYRTAMNYDARTDPAFDEPGVPRREGAAEGDPLEAEFVAAMQRGGQPPAQPPEDVAELRRWERFITRRLKDGKALRPFETQHVNPTLKAAIEGRLDGVTTVDAAKQVFADAIEWRGYP